MARPSRSATVRRENYLGSDALALAPFTDEVAYLEDGDWAIVTRKNVDIRDDSGNMVHRTRHKIATGSYLADKGNHRHFMAKEIHEQPEVVGRTLANYVNFTAGRVEIPFELPFDFKDLKRISISACGTAYLAGLVSKYWFERLARIPVEIDVASEFRYREAPLEPGSLAIFVSQSGETADTLASLRYAGAEKQHTLSVVNVPTSTMARESACGGGDARRSRDRRRLHQGLHVPAHASCSASPSRPAARAAP